MNKAYNRINWENYPSDATPLNDTNLNNLDSATDTIDDRVYCFGSPPRQPKQKCQLLWLCNF